MENVAILMSAYREPHLAVFRCIKCAVLAILAGDSTSVRAVHLCVHCQQPAVLRVLSMVQGLVLEEQAQQQAAVEG